MEKKNNCFVVVLWDSLAQVYKLFMVGAIPRIEESRQGRCSPRVLLTAGFSLSCCVKHSKALLPPPLWALWQLTPVKALKSLSEFRAGVWMDLLNNGTGLSNVNPLAISPAEKSIWFSGVMRRERGVYGVMQREAWLCHKFGRSPSSTWANNDEMLVGDIH